MQPTQNTYPLFEANQVLTNAHLNQIFSYLDKQEKLTRTNLIGIGIVCGLNIRLDTATKTIYLSKGCGITSEGYLVVEPADVALVAYKNYKLPAELAYPPLRNRNANLNEPYLWELFPAGEPDATLLNTPANFLNDKAVILFLELKKDSLRNCSPNNCDDKGAEVTATVRRLLISTDNLNQIIAEANQLNTRATVSDLESSLLTRLNLPDLRLPRYNVTNTNPVTSENILAAFHTIFTTDKLALTLGNALSAAYNAFKPVLEQLYNSNPFADFNNRFGFLDTAPNTTAQVRFLQYYVDFFDDLVQAYEEFRWKGIELLCVCCPPESWFPRHLMLGSLSGNANIYRHRFLASAAVSGCEDREQELKLLFQRLVEMITSFTNNPALPEQPTGAILDRQIRLTPSKLADVPLSDKAIPFYYAQTGRMPLYQLWNAQKTRRNRANQNLGYRSDEYTPAAPAFVTNALRFELAPYNFLRIEGHLGKNYQSVLSTLLTIRTQYRLPIEIVALRTGAFDERMPVDLSKESSLFQDLETLYDAFREDLLRNLTEGVMFLYDTPIPKGTEPGGTPALPLLKKYAPNFRYQAGTVGALFEKNLTSIQNKPYIDIDQNNINAETVILAYCILFTDTTTTPAKFQAHIVSIYYLIKLSEIMPAALDQLAFADFENKYQDLVGLTRYFRNTEKIEVPTQLEVFIPKEELIDYFNQVLYNCRLDSLKAIHGEYLRRIREVKQKQFLSFFLRNNPGIQHKAGVPLGGTFIVVYHDDPEIIKQNRINEQAVLSVKTENQLTAAKSPRTEVLSRAVKSLRTKQEFLADPDIQTIFGEITGELLTADIIRDKAEADNSSEKIFTDTVNQLTDGTVIADFYLPYICCSAGAVIQFVLPKIPPTFTIQVRCTNANGEAGVTITPTGGLPPYSIKVDNQDYRQLKEGLLLNAGTRKLIIKDAEGTESAEQAINIPGPLTLGEPAYDCIEGKNEYTVRFNITGGTAPYSIKSVTAIGRTLNAGTIADNQYSNEALPGNIDIEIIIADGNDCKTPIILNHSCLAPLAFTTTIGCTSERNHAAVDITPTGGQGPYLVQVGNGRNPATNPFEKLEKSINLPVGTHPIVVQDALGTTTGPQTVMIPPPLTWSITEYICKGTESYQAHIIIQGGTFPYFMDGIQLDKNTFTTEPIPNSKPGTFKLEDNNKCTKQIDVQHTCPEHSKWPCEGNTESCSYRLWLQPLKENEIYRIYNSLEQNIIFRYDNKEFFLPVTLINISVDELNGNFNNALEEVIKKLNQSIAEQIGEGLVTLALKFQSEEPLALLRIDYFDCKAFDIEFNHELSIFNEMVAVGRPPVQRKVQYMNKGQVNNTTFNGLLITILGPRGKETSHPASDCIKSKRE